MGRLKSASIYGEESGTVTHGLVHLGCILPVAAGFIGVGVLMLLPLHAAERDWSQVVFALLPIGMGLMFGWSIPAYLSEISRFGQSEAEVSPETISMGDNFTFRFQQHLKRPVRVHYIGVFLVFREKLTISDIDGFWTSEIDRLVEKAVHSGRKFNAEEIILEEHNFRIPSRKMGVRNSPIRNQRVEKMEWMWVVKVRLNCGKNKDVWREYRIEIEPDYAPEKHHEAKLETQGRFDVMLVRNSFNDFRTLKVTQELLPHLQAGQVADKVILENISEAEALSAKAKLEAVGAVVQVIPAFAHYEI